MVARSLRSFPHLLEETKWLDAPGLEEMREWVEVDEEERLLEDLAQRNAVLRSDLAALEGRVLALSDGLGEGHEERNQRPDDSTSVAQRDQDADLESQSVEIRHESKEDGQAGSRAPRKD